MFKVTPELVLDICVMVTLEVVAAAPSNCSKSFAKTLVAEELPATIVNASSFACGGNVPSILGQTPILVTKGAEQFAAALQSKVTFAPACVVVVPVEVT